MGVSELKKIFAASLLKEPGNPFKAGQAAYPDDIGECCRAATQWPNDPEVLAELDNLKNAATLEDQLPGKVEAGQLAWQLANNDWLKGKERVEALRLFCEVAGHIEKGTGKGKDNAEVNAIQKVMLVKDHGEIADWEQQLLDQQTRLINAD